MSPGVPKVVLYVEDDEELGDLVRLLFAREGWKVELAKDGVAAIDMIPHVKPDVIVLDLMLPRLGGLEVLEQLQAGSAARIPVIAVTGMNPEYGLKQKVLKYPDVAALMSKPFDLEALRAEVRQLLGKSQAPGEME